MEGRGQSIGILVLLDPAEAYTGISFIIICLTMFMFYVLFSMLFIVYNLNFFKKGRMKKIKPPVSNSINTLLRP